MPKVELALINDASFAAVGGMMYIGGDCSDKRKAKTFCELTGITKGQWKRFLVAYKARGHNSPYEARLDMTLLTVSELTVVKIGIIKDHAQNPHLKTLLKVAEARYSDVHP